MKKKLRQETSGMTGKMIYRLNPMNRPGIIQRIKGATTNKEMDKLLKELESYKDASPQTIRRAYKAAEDRRNQLS